MVDNLFSRIWWSSISKAVERLRKGCLPVPCQKGSCGCLPVLRVGEQTVGGSKLSGVCVTITADCRWQKAERCLCDDHSRLSGAARCLCDDHSRLSVAERCLCGDRSGRQTDEFQADRCHGGVSAAADQ